MKKLLPKIIKYILPYKMYLIAVLFSLIIVASSILGLIFELRILIDNGFKNHNSMIFNQTMFVLIFFIILLSVASYTRSSLINMVTEKIERDIRLDIFKHIIYMSPSFFEINKTSDIIARMTVDTTLLNSTIANISSSALRNMIMLLGGLISLIITSPKLSLSVLVIVPIVILPIVFLGRKVRILSKLTQEQVAIFSSYIEEDLNSIKTIQSFCKEDYEISLFNKTLNQTLAFSIKRIRYRSLLAALVICMVLSSISVVLWVGGNDVLKGVMTPGELVSFISYAILVASSLGALSEVFSDFQRAAAAAERIFDLTKLESEIKEPKNPHTISSGDVEFKNITFSYPTNKNRCIIDKLSLKIHKGEKLAIVGSSGAGKTTLFQLLLRFYDIDEGEIFLAGTNIKEFSIKDLRNQFAIVPQDPVIFSATAYDNIKFGNSFASNEDIIQAATLANIYDFIETLPNKMESFLGEKGVRVSGGQKQRIAIARAILKNPSILLLDEATSSLDAENEILVQNALYNLMHGRTTIIIAHRISTIKNADRIVIIDKGKISAIGTHNSLLENNELYNKLYQASN